MYKLAATAALALVATQLAAAGTRAANGTTIAFTSLRSGSTALWVANADGTSPRRLAAGGAGAYQGDPAWSPDGSRLVFTCGNFELCVANADGSGTARLTASTWPTTWSYDFEPAWSPDGTRIVFSGKRGSKSEDLWLVNADGSGLRKLVGTAADEGHPDWSPDGAKIVYSASSATGSDLYTVNADGSGSTRLTSSAKVDESAPDWSPDGSTIAYGRMAGGSLASQIWLMNAAGGGQRALTKGESAMEASWSPDGTLVLFTGRVGPDDELFSIQPNGTGRKRLSTARGGDYSPQLQPAGVTVTLPALPSLAPAPVHADARAVGTFLGRGGDLLMDFGAFETESLEKLLAAARELAREAGGARAALAATKPVSVRGKRVRTEGLAAFTAARAAGQNLLELARLAAQGPKAAKRVAALEKQFQANLNTFDRRISAAFAAAGI
jgi:dipeptidyl aminopeptidase/acylaminoacyl peptidase